MRRLGYALLSALILLSALYIPAGQAAEAAAANAVPQIYANEYSSVALISDGTVWAWGRGGNGQLGNGRWNNSSSPVKVSGLSDVKSIAATYYSAFAVKNDGTVRAWGVNDKGQLGDGTQTNQNVPVEVAGLSGISSISSGSGLHTLAVGEDGTLWAWGNNEDGQLGDGTTDQRLTPVEVPGLPPIVEAAVGGFFSLALASDGQVWSWGWNKQGQLGDGTADEKRLTPMPIAGLSGIVAVSAGYNHALALDENGDVWAWGQNTNGAVGDGTYEERRTPVKVAPLANVAFISAGFFHNLVIKEDGTVWGWGFNNQYQLGNGTTDKMNSPNQVSGLSQMAAVAAGKFHSLAMDPNGIGWAWGYNSGGLLGDGTGTDRSTPVKNSAAMDASAPVLTDSTLTVTDRQTTALTLSWQKADDNMTGRADLLYQVLLSDSGNIGTVYQAIMNGTAAEAFMQDAESLEVTGLDPDRTYYFNVIVVDGAGNISAYTMQQASTASETDPPSDDATLMSLIVNAGASELRLSPAFAPDVTEYATGVPYSVSSVSVTTAANDSHATVSASVYDGADRIVFGPHTLTDDQASDPLPLQVGRNRIELAVTAEDHSIKTYRMTVNRSGAPLPSTTPEDNEKPVVVGVTVNGSEMNAIATGTLQESGGQTTATISVDANRLETQLAAMDENPVIRLAVETDVDQTALMLNGQAVSLLRSKNAVLEIVTESGSYRLLAEQLPIDRLAQQFGTQVQPRDVALEVIIAKSGDKRLEELQSISTLTGFKILTSPVDFRVLVTYGGTSIEADRFDTYVEREIPMPEGESTGGTATAVVLEENGEIRHVPTRIIIRDGRQVAVVSSLTNSSYALIHHSKSFIDLNSHWAESAVNDMASRLIVNGLNNESFGPDGTVSRAEFAAMIVRALGLPASGAGSSFTDIDSGDWFAGIASKAQQYGIIEGEPGGAFLPDAPITRQEAAVIIARSWKLAEGEASREEIGPGKLPEPFQDADQIGSWASQSVQLTVQNGLFNGSNGSFMPRNHLTRAEAATVVHRLLKQSGLID